MEATGDVLYIFYKVLYGRHSLVDAEKEVKVMDYDRKSVILLLLSFSPFSFSVEWSMFSEVTFRKELFVSVTITYFSLHKPRSV